MLRNNNQLHHRHATLAQISDLKLISRLHQLPQLRRECVAPGKFTLRENMFGTIKDLLGPEYQISENKTHEQNESIVYTHSLWNGLFGNSLEFYNTLG